MDWMNTTLTQLKFLLHPESASTPSRRFVCSVLISVKSICAKFGYLSAHLDGKLYIRERERARPCDVTPATHWRLKHFVLTLCPGDQSVTGWRLQEPLGGDREQARLILFCVQNVLYKCWNWEVWTFFFHNWNYMTECQRMPKKYYGVPVPNSRYWSKGEQYPITYIG